MDAHDCQQLLVTGKCIFDKSFRFNHLTATKNQVASIKENFKCFIDKPMGIKGEKNNTTAAQ